MKSIIAGITCGLGYNKTEELFKIMGLNYISQHTYEKLLDKV